MEHDKNGRYRYMMQGGHPHEQDTMTNEFNGGRASVGNLDGCTMCVGL